MSIKSSNIDRLIAALHREKLDRVPNFEVEIESRNLSCLLEKKTDSNFTGISPQNAVKAAETIGQDAIPCNLRFYHKEEGSIVSEDDIRNVAVPDMEKSYEKLKEYCNAVKGTKVGVACCLTGPLTPAYMACGPVPIESFMYNIFDEPDLIEDLMDIFLKYNLELIDRIKKLPFDLFYIGDDVSYTSGTMINPAQLEQFWFPRIEQLIKAAKSIGKPVLFHCCGDQSALLPHFIQWGVDGVHPLQANANNIYQVFEKYGDRLTLFGNMDVMTVLSYGTPDEVSSDTIEHIQKLSKYGGYVVSSSHSIVDSVPPENFLAMIEAVHTYGVY